MNFSTLDSEIDEVLDIMTRAKENIHEKQKFEEALLILK